MGDLSPISTRIENKKESLIFNFVRHIDAKNASNSYGYNNPENVWCVAEVPILPMSFYDLDSDNYNATDYTKPMSTSHRDNTSVRMYFAFSANGLKTGPVFLIKQYDLQGKWFQPLDDILYSDSTDVHEFTSEKWFPMDSIALCTGSTEMTATDIDKVFSHLNDQIRSISNKNDMKLMFIPAFFANENCGLHHVCDRYHMEFVRFPKKVHSDIDPFQNSIFSLILSAMSKEEHRLDRLHLASRYTIQMKLMLGISGFNAITTAIIVLSFEKCRMWPLKTRLEDI